MHTSWIYIYIYPCLFFSFFFSINRVEISNSRRIVSLELGFSKKKKKKKETASKLSSWISAREQNLFEWFIDTIHRSANEYLINNNTLLYEYYTRCNNTVVIRRNEFLKFQTSPLHGYVNIVSSYCCIL